MEINEIVGELKSQPLHGLNPTERRYQLFVIKLSRVPVFREMVERFIKGHSATTVTAWFMALTPEQRGELAECGRPTCYVYISALHFVMRRIRTKVVERQAKNLVLLPKGAPPDKYGLVEDYLTGKLENREAMAMLQASFEIQYRRVRAMCELEDRLKMTLPLGHKEVRTLAAIAAEVRKLHLGEKMLDKGFDFDIKPIAPTLPAIIAAQELDTADKNLLRDATLKVIDLVRQEAGIGQYASTELEPDAGRTEGPQTPSAE